MTISLDHLIGGPLKLPLWRRVYIGIASFFLAVWWIIRFGFDDALAKAEKELIEARQELCRRRYGTR